KPKAHEMHGQQAAGGNADVSANPLAGTSICSTNGTWDYTLESTAEEFSDATNTSLPLVVRVDYGSFMRVLQQLEVIAKRQAPRIVIKAKRKVLFLPVAEIVAVQAEGNYISLRHRTNLYLLRESISSIEEKLRPYGFIRIHRSVIVNISTVE